jgi:hypothetical protein
MSFELVGWIPILFPVLNIICQKQEITYSKTSSNHQNRSHYIPINARCSWLSHVTILLSHYIYIIILIYLFIHLFIHSFIYLSIISEVAEDLPVNIPSLAHHPPVVATVPPTTSEATAATVASMQNIGALHSSAQPMAGPFPPRGGGENRLEKFSKVGKSDVEPFGVQWI